MHLTEVTVYLIPINVVLDENEFVAFAFMIDRVSVPAHASLNLYAMV